MEWLALSIGIGLVVSLIFTEAFGLSVGGMIVPGYLALAFDQPATIIATIVAALVTAWVVYQIDRWAILFGRRRVVLTMVVGFDRGSAAVDGGTHVPFDARGRCRGSRHLRRLDDDGRNNGHRFCDSRVGRSLDCA